MRKGAGRGARPRLAPLGPVKGSPWCAKWIWLDPIAFPDCQRSPFSVFAPREGLRFAVALLRRTFRLDGRPERAHAWVSADARYRLFVNGRFVGRGPAESGGDWGNEGPLGWWFFDSYDIAPFLGAGENVLAMEVALQGYVPADHSMGHGGALFEAEIEGIGAKRAARTVVGSDGTWRAALDNGFLSPESYDAACGPVGWEKRGFDDSAWHRVAEICPAAGGPWNLVPREIPDLGYATVRPVELIAPFKEAKARIRNASALLGRGGPAMRIEAGSPLTFWLRFEKEVSGYLRLTVRGAAGTELAFGFQESPGRDDRQASYRLRDGRQSFEFPRLEGLQYLRVTASFPNVTLGLVVQELSVSFASYPVSYRGSFACSDDALGAVWESGRWTAQLCMQGYHLDSPIHQEPLGCMADYMITALVGYCAFGDPRLARQDILRTSWLLQSRGYRMFHTSYSLQWIQMLVEYYDFSGDEELVRKVAPTVHALLDLFATYSGTTGLLSEAPNYLFMDWARSSGFDLHHPPASIGMGYLTAFYYNALRNAQRICALTGDDRRAEEYAARAATLKEAFNRQLWVEERGLYRDGCPGLTRISPSEWLPADLGTSTFSQHTNAVAVAYGLAPEERVAAVVERLLSEPSLVQAQPYFMHYVFEALARAGLFDAYGLGQMRRWGALLAEHAGSLKETWHAGDYSHAWSGTPTFQLSARVLGVMPAEPGFKVIRIQPCLGDLRWASGTVPTPLGDVRVEVRKRRSSGMTVTIRAPAPVRLRLPKERLRDPVVCEGRRIVYADGRPATGARNVEVAADSGRHIVLALPAGQGSFTICEARERASAR